MEHGRGVGLWPNERAPRPSSSLRVLLSLVGFSFCMAYLLMVGTGGMEGPVVVAGRSLDDADLVLFLLGCCASLLFFVRATPRARDAALASPVLLAACLLGAVCALGPLLSQEGPIKAALSFLAGVAGGSMLAAWGRAFQSRPAGSMAREALLACGLAALVCFAGSLGGPGPSAAVSALLALANIPCIRFGLAFRTPASRPDAAGSCEGPDGDRPSIGLWDVLATKEQRLSTKRLSDRMLCGAALYGVSAGFMRTFDSPAAAPSLSFEPGFLLLGLFAIAALQLLSDGVRPDGAKGDPIRADARCLKGSYRLALLLMMAGYLFAPVLSGFSIKGPSVVLAGFLGLQFVLAGMFLTVSKVTNHDAALSFARGFGCLYLGQAAGLGLGMVLELSEAAGSFPYFVAACAGLGTLFAYLFLFTEGDFDDLVSILAEADRFDEACELIASRFGLSKRESELLPFALRGRSGERIAAELFISKSTVETHLRRIYHKTGAANRQELIDLGENVQRELSAGGLR